MGLFLSGASCSDAHVRINGAISFAHLDLLAAFCTGPMPVLAALAAGSLLVQPLGCRSRD